MMRLLLGLTYSKLPRAVGNEKYIVYICGEQVEQHFAIGNFPVLLPFKFVRIDDQPDDESAHQQGDKDGNGSCPVHIRQHRRASEVGALADAVQRPVQSFQKREYLTFEIFVGFVKGRVSDKRPAGRPQGLPELGQGLLQSGQVGRIAPDSWP